MSYVVTGGEGVNLGPFNKMVVMGNEGLSGDEINFIPQSFSIVPISYIVLPYTKELTK